MDVFEKVKKILCDQLDLEEEQVTEEAEVIEDLGADSLDIVDLVMTLEEEFDTEIPDEDIENLKTVGAPGAVCLLEFPPRRAGKQARRFGRVMLHDGGNSYPVHVHH